MQSPRGQNQFFGMLEQPPLPNTPNLQQTTSLMSPHHQSLRYIANSNSPLHSPVTLSPKVGHQPGSMFPMPAPLTNTHPQEQIVGPSDHYGVHHQPFNSNSSPKTPTTTSNNYPNHNHQQQQQQQQRQNYNGNIQADIFNSKPFQAKQANETKVCVIVDSRTPVIIKVPVPATRITLADLKLALPALDQPGFKYFFKSNDSEFGIVKEEIQDDDSPLPTYRNRVVAWIVTPGRNDDELASRFKSETSDTCNMTYSNTSYDDGSSSILTTDLESTSYFTETDDDSNSCSNYSEITCETLISQRRNQRHRTNGRSPNNQHRKNNLDNNISSSTSSSSSSSNSSSSPSSHSSNATAVHCVAVHLVLTEENFLGLHVYRNSVNGVDDGIYVDEVKENSALAQDGRIEPGDKIIQVNDRNLEELTNDEAVAVLEKAVKRRGPIKLVVAKFIESERNDPISGIKEPIHPINTAAWVAHAQAMTIPSSQQQNPAHSASSSPSFGSNNQDTDCIRPASGSTGRLGLSLGLRLSKDMSDLSDIVMHMKMPSLGLDIRDRQWLKINIPNAFLGSDIVKWLERNVQGFMSDNEARKLATRMLDENIIQDPLLGKQFSLKSFYTFVT